MIEFRRTDQKPKIPNRTAGFIGKSFTLGRA